jgi:hypothetical protein
MMTKTEIFETIDQLDPLEKLELGGLLLASFGNDKELTKIQEELGTELDEGLLYELNELMLIDSIDIHITLGKHLINQLSTLRDRMSLAHDLLLEEIISPEYRQLLQQPTYIKQAKEKLHDALSAVHGAIVYSDYVEIMKNAQNTNSISTNQ